ncbi:hypothetical protein PR048_017756 [Dryococelus australis]|uniref:Transposable element P transposase-like GTP-binding insertion domain-containing protein n=1 Tax=Dryococelus australis TaxID=614101 RepID=A0ABQ9HAC5_9NEOP|nr:hypothetical protein PR048_017756 [Dryococelus australis]
MIDKLYVQHLFEKSAHDLKLVPNLTHHHLNVKGSASQKVKTTAQLFSNRVYEALVYLAAAEFIKLFNEWFDFMNSSLPVDEYGSKRQQQGAVINKMVALMETVRAKGLPFQDGIQISSKSLQNLFDYLNTFLQVRCPIMFFSYIRGLGYQNSHPSPIDFKYRIRNYIIKKHSSAFFSSKANTEDRVDETCLTYTDKQTSKNTLGLA